MTTTLRELTDAEVDAVTGGCHGTHHFGHSTHHFDRSPLVGGLFSGFFLAGLLHSLASISQSNITVQIGLALFGGSVSQTSISTNVSVVY